mgnify:CR=1 FL=1
MPNYGRDVPYPQNPTVLLRFYYIILIFIYFFSNLYKNRFSGLLRKIHLTWRAHKMISSLSPPDQLWMRRQVYTLDIFRGLNLI